MARGHRNQRGAGLTEIMVALTIGLFVVAGAISLFLGGRQSFRVQQALAQIQENMRSARHYLSIDIRQAGYIGCLPLGAVTPSVESTSAQDALTAQTAIQGYGSAPGAAPGMSWPSGWPAKPANLVPGTDALRVMRATQDAVTVVSPMTTRSAQIKVSGYPFGLADSLLITDCSAADIFTPTGVSASGGVITISHGSAGNTSPLLSTAYADGATVSEFDSTLYYVGLDASGNPNLYRFDSSTGETGVVADGVSGLWLEYGYDSSGDGSVSEYLKAPAVWAMAPPGGWANVRSVRLAIAFESHEDHLTKHPQSYDFGGPKIAADHKIHAVLRFLVTRRE